MYDSRLFKVLNTVSLKNKQFTMVHLNSKNLIHCFYSRNPQIDFLKKLLKNKIKKVKNMHITYI